MAERDRHLGKEIRCAKSDPPVGLFDVGYNEQQKYQLWTEPRRKGLSEVEKWTDMYRILFPQDDENDIPKPCE